MSAGAFLTSELSSLLPQLRTRQALLVLDLQNEFVGVDGNLPVSRPTAFLDRIKDLIPLFRTSGEVVWIRTELTTERQFNDPSGSGDRLITDNELSCSKSGLSSDKSPALSRPAKPNPAGRHLAASNDLDEAVSIDSPLSLGAAEETYLSVSSAGQPPICCQPGTSGAQFADIFSPLIDQDQDTIFVKSHYSAFNETSLLQWLRMNLVTDLFICGTMSNISIFATASDAAQHGLAITLVNDCLGYRDKSRHEEAVKQMEEYFGADSVSSAELIQRIRPPSLLSDENGPEEGQKKADRPVVGATHQPEAPSPSVDSTTTDTSSSEEADQPATRKVAAPAPIDEAPIEVDSDDTGADELSALSIANTLSSLRQARNQGAFQSRDMGARRNPRKPLPSTSGKESRGLEDAPGTGKTPIQPKDVPSGKPRIPSDQSGRVLVRTEAPARSRRRPRSGPTQAKDLGPEDTIGEGDSRIFYDFLHPGIAEHVFESVKREVQWQVMHHRGGEVPRLVAVQGKVSADGTIPIYRHPSDESPPLLPFSPTVEKIRKQVEQKLRHPINHVLIQHYRHGEDYISEHSDKTLDIVRGSSIVNVSLGAQRTMTLRTKKSAQKDGPSVSSTTSDDQTRKSDDRADPSADPVSRQTQRVPLPANSMFVLGQDTNMRWLHAIRQDKRPQSQQSEAERAYGGERISLTFRHMGTYLDKDQNFIWGQGATSKTKFVARKVLNGNTPEAQEMITAFGRENRESEFDWDAAYGGGFDALHIVTSLPKLYITGDAVTDVKVKLLLAEAGVQHETFAPTKDPSLQQDEDDPPDISNLTRVRFVDNDPSSAEIEGTFAIMFYVERFYRPTGVFSPTHTKQEIATGFSAIDDTHRLNFAWQQLTLDPSNPAAQAALRRQLQGWEARAQRAAFIAGDVFAFPDCVFWPILNNFILEWDGWDEDAFPALTAYHQRVVGRPALKDVMRESKLI